MKCLQLPATKKGKATSNVKILVLSHRMGDLGVTHRVHLWLDGKHVVDFLLAIIAILAIALTDAALLCEICRNQRFLKRMDHSEHKCLADGDVAGTLQLIVPPTRCLTLSDRAFSVATARAWNALSHSVSSASSLSVFLRRLKTHLFRCSFYL